MQRYARNRRFPLLKSGGSLSAAMGVEIAAYCMSKASKHVRGDVSRCAHGNEYPLAGGGDRSSVAVL